MKHLAWREHPALAHAKRLRGARQGPPTDADAPVRRGRGPKPLPGQLDIYGKTHGEPPQRGGKEQAA